jgi:DNA-directed RNA polymerase specialized sigma24 family protein
MSMPLSATDLLAELPRLRRYARVLTGDPELADTLVEATLLRFRHGSAETASPSTRTLELFSLLRAVSVEKALSGADPAPNSAGFSGPARWFQAIGAQAQRPSTRSLPDRAVEMLAQLGELPLEQREVLVLVAVEQLSYGDVANLLGIPVATVISRLSEARAALRAAATKAHSAPTRKSPAIGVVPFESNVVSVRLNARDSVMTNAEKLAAIGGGGTNCSAPLAFLNSRQAQGDLVVFVSDNESWVDAKAGRGTATMREWAVFQARNPQAKLVCIDLQPYATTQAQESASVLNIGGFSDQVFEVIAAFAEGRLGPDHWVGEIDAVEV